MGADGMEVPVPGTGTHERPMFATSTSVVRVQKVPEARSIMRAGELTCSAEDAPASIVLRGSRPSGAEALEGRLR